MTVAVARHPVAIAAVPPELGGLLWPDAVPLTARAGRTILAPGAESDRVYVMLEGRVQVALFSSAGSEVVLRDLGPGALFGDLAAIDGQPRSASIVAITDCLLASVAGARFRDAVCHTPEAALWMARRFAGQIRALSEKLFELNTLTVPGRLHCELLRLCHAGRGDGVIDPLPTHAELASRIGTHREAVTREIGFLTKSNVLVPVNRRSAKADLAALTRLVRAVAGDHGDTMHDWSGK